MTERQKRTMRAKAAPVMASADRKDWIEEHMTQAAVEGERHVARDVLSRDFVDAYIEATNAAFRPTAYGAYKCPMLGRDLAEMVEEGRLRRTRIGIEGLAGMGFPRWVWSYRIR
ncbi:hypothetical protein [Sphingomonas phage Birtae]|nr:hypothetical protein [Sphingomonas phage Birtae]